MVWQYFTLDELKCKCGKCNSTGEEMDNDFMQSLIILRKALNVPFVVGSAYRCPQHNAEVSTTRNAGVHTTGRAIDIDIEGQDAFKLVQRAIMNSGLFTGIGISQREGKARYIHLDNQQLPNYPRPRIWSY